MKNWLRYINAFLCISLLASCSRETDTEFSAIEDTAEFSISAVEDGSVRTYLDSDGRTLLWGSGEYLQLYYNDGSAKFAKSLGSSADKYNGSASAVFDFSVSAAAAAQYAIGGVYPASSVINVGGINNDDPSAYKINLKSAQTSSGGKYDPEAFIMVMRPETVSALSGEVNGYFRRAVALNHFVLTGVKEAVSAVEVTVEGFALAGKREINLTNGQSGNVYEPSESVTVQFDASQTSQSIDLWFTSWDVLLPAGGKMKVRVIGENNTYTKTIQAGDKGITLAEGCLNSLSIDFSSVEADTVTLGDFAKSFAGILGVWKSTLGDVSVATGSTPEVHKNVNYLPSDLKISVAGNVLNKANMLDVAIQGLVALNDGGSLNDKMPSPHSYSWGDNPYNELPGNGGEFGNSTVSYDFIRNFSGRQSDFAASNSQWSNFCGYTNAQGTPSTAGNPQVTGYKGVCCLERGLLILARFYAYLQEKGITDNVATKCASATFNAGLYAEATEPVVTTTIKDFATAYVKVIDTWKSNSSTTLKVGDVTINGHYVPAATKVSFGDLSLDKAKTLDIAMKSMYALLSGGSLSDGVPAADAVKWSTNPYLENPVFTSTAVSLDFLKNYASRQQNYAKNNGNVWANFCGYGSGGATEAGTPQVSGFKGNCSLERFYLIMARFYKYILDKNITSGFATALAGISLDADLYGVLAPVGSATVYGLVSCSGKGVGGVVVTDGYNVVVTNEYGEYQLTSKKKNNMVWISLPSGYRTDNLGIQSLFYKNLTKAAATPERVDFKLYKDGDQTNHKMIFIGDMHLCGRSGSNPDDRAQFAKFTKELESYVSGLSGEKVYALTLGDMTWDCYWYSYSYNFSNYLKDINANVKSLTVYHTMGNHDNDMKTSVNGSSKGWDAVDWDTANAYRKALGPNYYSFNIGDVHYVSLDNIYCTNTTGGTSSDRHYEDKVSADAIAWLKKDLSHVDKSKQIVVTMHAAYNTQSGSLSLDNGEELASCLSAFSKVLFVTGHTHRMHTNKSGTIREHNSGSVCATWWWCGKFYSTLNIGTDGSPGGYRIMDFKGTDYASYYKAVGRKAKYQFRTYDRNKIKISTSGVKYASAYSTVISERGGYGTASSANEVIINVWDWSKDWKVEVTENGKALTVTRFSGYDPLFFLTYYQKMFDMTSTPSFNAYKTNHLFKVTASSASSTLTVKVTDDEGRVYTETMTRPKAFTIDTYK